MASRFIQLRVLVQEDELEVVREVAKRRSVGESKWMWRELAAVWARVGISDRVTEERARLKRQSEAVVA